MNTHELEALQQAQAHIYKVLAHKQPCRMCDHSPTMVGCGNLADGYVLLMPDNPKGDEKPAFRPSCYIHMRLHQQLHLTDWQERVVEEREELHGRIVRLRVFEGGKEFAQLPGIDQLQLATQLDMMLGYLNSLTTRIKRFTGGYDIELPSE